MPEIAEVETVRNTLKKQLINKTIIKVDVLYPKIIETSVDEFKERLVNQKFIDIKRVGKWLVFITSDYVLLSHLRMEGKYFIKNEDEEIVKHEHIIFHLDDHSTLRYHDTRKFGKMILSNINEYMNLEPIKKQGLEPIDNISVSYLKEKLKNKRLAIKTCLLDQTIISGLGNIYANEVLFASQINPLKSGCDVTDKELNKIIIAAKDIINRAIIMGGTTIKSYTSSLGVTGRFQQELKVHKREGELCYNCHTRIENIRVNGRSTYYCPNCQK